MNIIGIDALLFGVDDLAECTHHLRDYGLLGVQEDARGSRFEARDGTGITLRWRGDATLPAALGTASMLRETVYGVADRKTLNAIAEELGRDRRVQRHVDGSIHSTDDMGFALGFQVSTRRPLRMLAGSSDALIAPARGSTAPGIEGETDIVPHSLSHVVYFVPDPARAEAFYVDRLGFRVTDRFVGVGPFLRPAGTAEHHTLFMIQAPRFMKGCEHFSFRVGGPGELLRAGSRFAARGHRSFWGPGRHRIGSNWFWYFESPLGCHIEYDADMDVHDDLWQPREVPIEFDSSQLFMFQESPRRMPGGPSH